MVMFEESLEVKLPAIWTDGKAEVGRVREEKRRVLRGWRKVFLHLVKREQNVRICSSFKNNGRRGTLEEEMQRCIFSGRHSTRDMFIRDVI